MIHIELEVRARKLTAEQEDELRLAIRQATLPFLFQVVDSTAATKGWDLSHKDIGVTGEIKIKDN